MFISLLRCSSLRTSPSLNHAQRHCSAIEVYVPAIRSDSFSYFHFRPFPNLSLPRNVPVVRYSMHTDTDLPAPIVMVVTLCFWASRIPLFKYPALREERRFLTSLTPYSFVSLSLPDKSQRSLPAVAEPECGYRLRSTFPQSFSVRREFPWNVHALPLFRFYQLFESSTISTWRSINQIFSVIKKASTLLFLTPRFPVERFVATLQANPRIPPSPFPVVAWVGLEFETGGRSLH